MTLLATILYEDSSSTHARGFGLHRLVVRCVHDRKQGDLGLLLRAFADRPMKSNTKVRTACREERLLLTRTGASLVALYDDDRVRELLHKPKAACKQEVRQALLQECGDDPKLRVVLLVKNTESVLATLEQSGLMMTFARTDFHEAIARKSVLKRDEIFHRAADADMLKVREHLCQHLPSFEYLIAKLIELVP